jgi:large-conductance mechanosensitive channel
MLDLIIMTAFFTWIVFSLQELRVKAAITRMVFVFCVHVHNIERPRGKRFYIYHGFIIVAIASVLLGFILFLMIVDDGDLPTQNRTDGIRKSVQGCASYPGRLLRDNLLCECKCVVSWVSCASPIDTCAFARSWRHL